MIDTIEKWQQIFYEKYGLHFIHAGDEWYILAEREIPTSDSYDGYLQLENGVGMLRLLFDEVDEALDTLRGGNQEMEVSLATGELAYPYLKKILDKIQEKFVKIWTYFLRKKTVIKLNINLI